MSFCFPRRAVCTYLILFLAALVHVTPCALAESVSVSADLPLVLASDHQHGHHCTCSHCQQSDEPGGIAQFLLQGGQQPQPGGDGTPVEITYSYNNFLDGGLKDENGVTVPASYIRTVVEEAFGLWVRRRTAATPPRSTRMSDLVRQPRHNCIVLIRLTALGEYVLATLGSTAPMQKTADLRPRHLLFSLAVVATSRAILFSTMATRGRLTALRASQIFWALSRTKLATRLALGITACQAR